MTTPKEKLYLAIDQGGHASRALLYNNKGEVISEGYQEIGTDYKNDNWVEHDAEELIRSINKAIDSAIASLIKNHDNDHYELHSAGLATQRSSIVCWDKTNGNALSPVISWQDRRAASWVAQFNQHGSKIHKTTGLHITAHYGVSKLRWCLDNLPTVKQACTDNRLAWGPLASFIVFRLLEEHPLLVDPANASRTLLWNRHTLDWDDELIALFDVPKQPLPACVPTYHRYGQFRVNGKIIPLNTVTGDQSAALFAYGEPKHEAVYINIGTGAFVQRMFSHEVDYAPKLLTSVVSQIDNNVIHVLEGTVNGAGSAFVDMEQQLGVDPIEVQKNLPHWLAKNASVPLYLNGVSGLGSPFWIPDFNSTFIGEGEPWKKIVSVAESIIFLIVMNLQEMDKVCPSPEYIVVTGGISKNKEMCQRLASLSQKKLFRPAECEATARGTAYLLTNKKMNWSDEKSGQWILPTENISFKERFAQWRQEMESALSNR